MGCLLKMRLFLSIIFFGECIAQFVDNPSCSFHGPNGYTLTWSADPSGIIHFNYTQSNFPTTGSYWTGVSFGTASDSYGDAIIFETQNGQLTVSSGKAEASRSCSTCRQQGSVLQKSASNILSISYSSFSSGIAKAQFSRPLFNNGITLASCNFWIFYTQPTPVHEKLNSFTTSATPIPQQICDIVNSCPLSPINGPSSTLSSQYTSTSFTTHHTTPYPSTYSTTTPVYQPQYDRPLVSPATVYSIYNNNAGYTPSNSYLPNTNYQFLNSSLQQQYLGNSDTHSSAMNTPLHDESNQQNPPVLTNAEQNQVNYQKILHDYQANPNPSADTTFTNNIYGYDYNAGSASSSYFTSSPGSAYSSGSNSPLYTGTSYSPSPYNSVYSNPTYSIGSVSGSSYSSSSVSRPQFYYYSSVYPSYLVPGPYYYRLRDIGLYSSSSNKESISTSSSNSLTYSDSAAAQHTYSTPTQLSADSSFNALGFNPLTDVYIETSSGNGKSSSASVSASFTPHFYSPFVQPYANRQYDSASATGTAYGPNSISYQVLEPHSTSYYQATLANK